MMFARVRYRHQWLWIIGGLLLFPALKLLGRLLPDTDAVNCVFAMIIVLTIPTALTLIVVGVKGLMR